MRVALYARVSSHDERQDPETQLIALRKMAEARGWQITEEFVDHASGARADRPALDRLMKHARRRECDGVMVWKFDRFGRKTQHLLEALEEFRSLGVDFISLTEAIDTSTPMGRMVYSFLASVAEFERALAQERSRAGQARARAQGKTIGRPRVIRDAEEIWKLRIHNRMTFRAIARRLRLGYGTIVRAYNQQKEQHSK